MTSQPNYELGRAALLTACNSVNETHLLNAQSTEADTRAKLIDLILTKVLHWPEESIIRETPSESGRSDYVLKCPKPTAVVEAKRFGVPFVLPKEVSRREYSVATLRAKGDSIGEAINQARSYADDNGIEFAIATNGSQWIVFRATTPGSRWVDGRAIVFRGLKDLESSFIEFWNLLAYENVCGESLRTAFSQNTRPAVKVERALDSLLYADNPLQRNKLSSQLHPLISAVFKDLTGTEQEEILRQCYVVDRLVAGVADDVSNIFSDTLPEFARKASFQDLLETTDRSGALDDDFQRAVSRGDFGSTILLLGGVGSGKTTFIHRLLKVTAKKFVQQHCVWFYVPFTNAPIQRDEFELFVRQSVLTELKLRYPEIDTTSPTALRRIYRKTLDEHETGLWKLYDKKEKRKAEVDLLERLIQAPEHCDAILRHIRAAGLAVTIVIDNVDQRAPSEQLALFLLAHALCVRFDAVVIVALREESFFRAEQSGAFNAYHNIRYHIASPDVRSLLRRRVEYALDASEQDSNTLRIQLRSGQELNSKQIRSFMRILNEGALKLNPAISQFIDAISQGNMRQALDMFNQFMVSGSTNVEKMLDFYNKEGRYNVAEHEFIKAVMQGDFQFYRESRSQVLNLFEMSGASGGSNLTTLRLLEWLGKHSGFSHAEGVGFVGIESALGVFDEVFGQQHDARFHLERLLRRRLVETDNRQTDSLGGAVVVRLTRSGEYFRETLSRRFQYLDMVCLDTPIWDKRVVHEIRSRASTVSLDARLERVEWFLTYLYSEEERSLEGCSRKQAAESFGDGIVQRVEQGFRSDLQKVARSARIGQARLAEIQNRVRASART